MTTATPVVTGVDFVSLPASDLEAAMAFYGNVLGLPRSSVWQRPGMEPVGAEFETGTVTVALIASERLGIAFQPNKVPIALHVEDVETARTELESRGISFAADTIDSSVCHMANFEDPDGNALCSTTATRHARPGPDGRTRGGEVEDLLLRVASQLEEAMTVGGPPSSP